MPSLAVTRPRVSALIYTRVSREDLEHLSIGLASQRAACERYAAEHGWIAAGVFEDVMTGSRDDRRGYQALLACVRQARNEGQSVTVLVAALDRLARRMVEALRCRDELRELGVPVHFVREGGELSDLVANVLAAVAQEEVRQVSARSRAAFRHRAAAGWYASSNCPWGYLRRPATLDERQAGAGPTVLDRDPSTSPVVRELFERVAAGERPSSAVRWLATLDPTVRNGRRFDLQAVWPVLHSPTYVGRPLTGPVEVLARPVGRWPALVEDATWQHAQAVIAEPYDGRATGRHLLIHFLCCSRCGRRAACQPPSKTNGRSYVCRDRVCRAYIGSALQLELVARRKLARLVRSITDPRLQTPLRAAWHHERREPSRLRVEAAEQRQWAERAETAERRLRRAAELWVLGDLDQEDYALVQRRADQDRIEALWHLRATPSVAALPTWEEMQGQACEWAAALSGSATPAQRRVFTALVERVERVRSEPRHYQVEVKWTVLGTSLVEAVLQARQAMR